MSVQRVPQVPFAQIANAALRDKRLSFKARGILALVLSHSGEWSATKRWLESQSDNDGRASIQSALNELTMLGYRTVTTERGSDGIRTVVIWRHEPEQSISCRSGNLTATKPDGQETGSSLEHNSSEHHKEEQHTNNLPALRPVEASLPLPDPFLPVTASSGLSRRQIAFFDSFWDTYPRKAAKGAARRAWESAIRKTDPQVILLAASVFANDPNRDPQFTPHPATWLNQERWNDDPLPQRGSGKTTAGDARMDNYGNLWQIFERESNEQP